MARIKMKKIGIIIGISILFILSILFLTTRTEYRCANTCETRLVYSLGMITLYDQIKSNSVSEWVRNHAKSKIENDWVFYEKRGPFSTAGGTISRKAHLLRLLYKHRHKAESEELLQDVLTTSDPVPESIVIKVKELSEGPTNRSRESENPLRSSSDL